MDVFNLRDSVINDYAAYMRSFIEIADPRVSELVTERLPTLWPEPLLQLNPAFEPGQSLADLIRDGLLHPACAEIFQHRPEGAKPQPLHLYRHQVDGIRAAQAGDNYVLTTGTGSGKSLSYIVPIVDHVLRARGSAGRGIQAIIVYPMNALANSQREELRKYLGAGARPLVSFARYTGQEDEAERERLRQSPPDILLTNYVMLELILTRPEEKRLIEHAAGLRFLVLDELHTYRGRQGADVALLCRRVREACRAERLVHIGTSATLASEGTWEQQRQAVAAVATTIFGAVVEPRRVIGETLRRLTPELDLDDPHALTALRARVIDLAPPATTTAFLADPLASWLETALGIRLQDGRFVRQRPRPLAGPGGVSSQLAYLLDLPPETCADAIRRTLLSGHQHTHDGRPLLAFRLHQFIAKGDTVYASLDPPHTRFLTLQRQIFVPGSDKSRLLLPLCFCRECGQDFYSVRRVDADGGPRYDPRELADLQDHDDLTDAGFLLLNADKIWPSDPDAQTRAVPESWLEEHKNKLRIRSERRARLPRECAVSPLGLEGRGDLPVCFIPAPFLFCPRCGVAYDARQKSDFGKLGTLGSEGRSTATTILTLSTLRHLRRDRDLGPSARKLLSFTDNRQDAALQAGHFNDFVSLGLVRSGLQSALQSAIQSADRGITHDELPQRVFDALDLPMRLYAQNPEVLYGPREAVQRALRRVLAYNLYRDLARGWRLTSPNLEQCGLLTIEYHDLARFCAEAEIWSECHPSLHAAAPALRQTICEVLLNNLRRELAIYTDALDPEKQEQIRLDAGAQLIDPWCFGEADRLVQSVIAIPGSSAKTRGKRTGGRFYHISARSGFGQYLRRSTVLGAFGKLNLQDTEEIIRQLFRALTKLGALHEHPAGPRGGGQAGYQVAAASMIWRRGDGKEAVHDPIRVPSAPSRGLRPNPFFNDFYRADARDLAAFEAREHTAQVRADERERREDRFRRAELPLLFCSPTMELGVDIAELNVVNMRNVPPTPANYAQRSGRAGRSGQPAFVFTYCSAQSPHDQHFFTHPERMVAGEVTPPRLDLQNEDLLRAHVHAIWLAEAGLGLGSSLAALLDLVGDDPSLHPEPRVQAALTDPSAQARAFERARAALGDAITGLYPSDPAACDAWLAAVVEGVPSSFNRACGRWQTLYRAAHEQARRQHAVYGDRSRPQQEREQARRLLAEANAQLDLLAAPKAEFHSDFYSYRYFASEGFLPGYNFPRLPLSAYLPSARRRRGPDDEFLSRPRFLAVAEFGPRSIIYHEGSRFEINKVILGAEAEKRGPDGLCTRALRCGACGAIEPVSGPLAPDRCPACDALAGHIDQNLFRMRNVVARRRDRITSDEEERLRIGYDLRTNIHFPAVDGDRRRRTAALIDQDGAPLATLTYGHAANIWRINLGWRRRKDTDPPGFLLDTERGIWASKKDPEELDPEPDEPTTPQQQRVIPYVEDTRNSLLIDPAQPLGGAVMASLQAALKSAIQREFQIEDRELAAEPLPSRDDRRRLLFYEAAEGGAGVLRRLLEDKGAMSRVARQALTLCHFDPDTGKDLRRAAPEREECEAACYDCLLSYFNQPDHRSVDRQLLPQLLLSWSKGQVEHSASPTAADAGDHRATLLAACDSDLERRFLDHLHHRGHRLPNRAQVFIAAADTRVDFLYTPDPGSQVAIYVDGPHHDTPDVHRRDLQQQELLEDAGYLVLRFHHAADWSAIIAAYPSTFGAAPTPAPTPPARPATRLLDPPLDPPPDPLLELLDLFDDLWRPLIRQLAALPGLSVDAGEDLGDRVAASTIARLDRDDRSLFLIDAADPRAPTAHQHLAARRRRGLNVRPDTPVAAILAALDGPR